MYFEPKNLTETGETYYELMANEEEEIFLYCADDGSENIDFFLHNVLRPFLEPSSDQEAANYEKINAHFDQLLRGGCENHSLRGIRFFRDRIEVIQACYKRKKNGEIVAETTHVNTLRYARMPEDSFFTLGINVQALTSDSDPKRVYVLFNPEEMSFVDEQAEKTFCAKRVA